jgi:hypothetical protein
MLSAAIIAAIVIAASALTLASGSPLKAQDNEAYVTPDVTPEVSPCTKDTSYTTFITELKSVVRRKQVARLLAMTKDDVQNRFPFEIGKSEFRMQWYLKDNPNKSDLWPTLRGILNQPCTQADGMRAMSDGDPYGYFMLVQKVDGRWMIASISGDPG